MHKGAGVAGRYEETGGLFILWLSLLKIGYSTTSGLLQDMIFFTSPASNESTSSRKHRGGRTFCNFYIPYTQYNETMSFESTES